MEKSKLWEGRFAKGLNGLANDFNASIHFDKRLYREDIAGSVAHGKMLGKQGIISKEDRDKILLGLEKILSSLEMGELDFDLNAEDIHSFIEQELTKEIGEAGKRLHTARSRNDQVALDLRMYLKREIDFIIGELINLCGMLCEISSGHTGTIMPGYTHLQRAQPISFAHHLMAYVQMFLRDIDRLYDVRKRTNSLPLGSCALAGTTYDIDRGYIADILGFSDICGNSIDGVSDRDFVIELANAISLIMVHLSRFSEEITLWCSWEFKFVELDDSYSTGSSIMPQKKNPDIAELVRGKSGRVFGNQISLLTMLKGLPLAYNKDMQEDKEAIFDSVDTVKMCLGVFIPMVSSMKVNRDRMREASAEGFINATDCADYLTSKGIPFRTAYKIVGKIVYYCIEQKKTLEALSLGEYQKFSEEFEDDIYEIISLDACLERRNSEGGVSPLRVMEQIEKTKSKLEKIKKEKEEVD